MANTNNKISLIVENQLPSFVRDDYRTFVSFVQAYYEYLEQSGKLIDAQQDLQELFDVDETTDDFLEYFQSKFLFGFPSEILSNKQLLLKYIKDFYLSKGTEKSVKFLFQALYGESIELFYPNRAILKVSDGKWVKEKSIRISGNMFNTYTGDGNTTVFLLSESVEVKSDITVFVNDIELSDSLYGVSDNELTFISAIGDGDIVKVEIENADFNKFVGLEIAGSESGATAYTSRYQEIYDRGAEFRRELIVSNIVGTFQLGEEGYTFYTDPETGTVIRLSIDITSSLASITIIDGGASYNVGDPVTISGGGGQGANAFISSVYDSAIERVVVNKIGAGFKPNVYFEITGGGGQGAIILLDGIDSTGNYHSNTYNISNDIIQTYANTPLSNNAYGFPAFANANLNTVLSSAFSYAIYGLCGPIVPEDVLIIDEGGGYTSAPTITLPSPIVALNSNSVLANVAITDFGILGTMQISVAGANYATGDELIFTSPPSSTGIDAAAAVTEVSETGGIARVEFQAPRISGTVNVVSGNAYVAGTDTNFTRDTSANGWLIVNNEIRQVNTIYSNTSLSCYTTFTYSANTKKLGFYGRNFVGGSGWEQTKLPSVSVQSANGTNANISVLAIIGDGELLTGSSINQPGQIREITLSSRGEDYTNNPTVDLTSFGNGLALANAQISGGFFEYPGFYRNSDGFVSGPMKLQGRHFYQFFSYVIKSSKTLDTYEKILRNLVHPVGLKYFAEYTTTPVVLDMSVEVVTANSSAPNNIIIGTF